MEYANPLRQTLEGIFSEKSFLDDIQENYLSKIGNVAKWQCYSDYCLNDDKSNKVISFTLIPYLVNHEELSAEIHRILKRDIKQTRNINSDAALFLKNFPLLNFSFILEEHRFLMSTSQDGLKTILKNTFSQLIQQLQISKLGNSKNTDYTEKKRAKYKEVLSFIDQNKKIARIRDMLIVSSVGGHICNFIAKKTKAELIGWFSDRDAINDIADNVSASLFYTALTQGLSHKCEFGYSRANSSANEFYEEFTRIPDFFSGTLADYNFKDETITKDKFKTILMDILADNRINNFIFKLKFNGDGSVECSRVVFIKKLDT